jgi:hypothetical protein
MLRDLLPTALIGAALGFLALFLREMGLAFAGMLGLVLVLYYASKRRYRAIAWLLIGGAGVWMVLLGRIIVLDLGSANIGTVPETYVGFFGAVMIVGFGLVLLVTVGSDRNPKPSG